MEYNNIINLIGIYKDINTMAFQESMEILKNAEIEMNLQKKREQEDALASQEKGHRSSRYTRRLLNRRSNNEKDDDLAFVIRKANKMMRRKFYKNKGF